MEMVLFMTKLPAAGSEDSSLLLHTVWPLRMITLSEHLLMLSLPDPWKARKHVKDL